MLTQNLEHYPSLISLFDDDYDFESSVLVTYERANCSTSTSIFMCRSLGIFYFTRLTQNFERSPAQF